MTGAVSPTPEEAAETVREALDADDSLDGSQIAAAHVALDSLLVDLRDARRASEIFRLGAEIGGDVLYERLQLAERERDQARDALRVCVGESYNLLTQGESPTQRRQPSARRIYDVARAALGGAAEETGP